jgi:hypothetical protein
VTNNTRKNGNLLCVYTEDEQTGQINEKPLSQSEMAASAYIKSNPAKLIHDHMFGY